MRQNYSIYKDARYSEKNPLAVTLANAKKRTTRNKLKDLENAVDALTIDVSNREYVAQFISDLERHAEENSYLRRTPNSNHREQWKTLSEKLRSKYTAFESFVEHPLTSTVDSLVSYEQQSTLTPAISEKSATPKQDVTEKTAAQGFVNLPLFNAMLLAEDPRTRLDQMHVPKNQAWYAQESARLRELSAQADAARSTREMAYESRYHIPEPVSADEKTRTVARVAGKIAAGLLLGATTLLSSSSESPHRSSYQTPTREVSMPLSDSKGTVRTASYTNEIEKQEMVENSNELKAPVASRVTIAPLTPNVTPRVEPLERRVGQGVLDWIASATTVVPQIAIEEKARMGWVSSESRVPYGFAITPVLKKQLPVLREPSQARMQWVPSDSVQFPEAALARVEGAIVNAIPDTRILISGKTLFESTDSIEVRHQKLMEHVIKPGVREWKLNHVLAPILDNKENLKESGSIHPEALVLDPIGRAGQIKRQKEWLAQVIARWSGNSN